VACALALTAIPGGLDQAALEAIRRWRFEPATLDGKPLATGYNLTMNFTLQ
jgi:protein TonB